MNLRGYCSISSPTFLQLCRNFLIILLGILEFLRNFASGILDFRNFRFTLKFQILEILDFWGCGVFQPQEFQNSLSSPSPFGGSLYGILEFLNKFSQEFQIFARFSGASQPRKFYKGYALNPQEPLKPHSLSVFLGEFQIYL